MEFFYPFFISFCIIFFSELGDKTQLLVLSFSAKSKTKNILLGVAIGTFFSHGIAILFGSKLSYLSNASFQTYLKTLTYISFIVLGIVGFIFKEENNPTSNESKLLKKFSNSKINYIIIIAVCIIIGELGDKTLLASLGIGIQYPNCKLSLILGSITGMVLSNSVAIFFGKFITKYLNENTMKFLSNILFIIFGLIGLLLNIHM